MIPVLAAAAGFVAGRMTGKKKSSSKKKTTKKGNATAKKAGAKKPSTKRKSSAKKSTSKSVAINKTTGRLKKGYRYGKGGRIVKAKSSK